MIKYKPVTLFQYRGDKNEWNQWFLKLDIQDILSAHENNMKMKHENKLRPEIRNYYNIPNFLTRCHSVIFVCYFCV